MPKNTDAATEDLEGLLAIRQSGTDRNQAGAARTLSANHNVIRPDEQPPKPTEPPAPPPPKPSGTLRHP